MSIAAVYRNRGLSVPALPVRAFGLHPLSADPSLVSYWPLDGNSRDAKGSNNGIDTSVTYSAANGLFNQGAGFNGSAKINIGHANSLLITGSLTVMAWVKIPTSSVYERVFWMLETDWGSMYRGYGIQATATLGVLQGGVYGGSAAYYENGITPIKDSIWRHVAMTFSATNGIRLYVNGCKEMQTRYGSVPSTIAQPTIDGYIGATNEAGTMYYASNGVCIDDMVLFSRELSQPELRNYCRWAVIT